MVKSLTIRYLKRDQIDVTRWDACINTATNGSPYALHDYLDALTPDWEALVAGEYEFVMPLPRRKKWMINYLYQPFVIPHLGVYGIGLNEHIINEFMLHIPSIYKRIDITLNPNSIPTIGLGKLTLRKSYILDLRPNYEILYDKYRTNHKRNISKSNKIAFELIRMIDPVLIYEMAEMYLRPRGHFDCSRKLEFIRLMAIWMKTGRAKTYGVYFNDTLIASAIFLIYKKRAYYLIAGNHPDGKTLGASHALIDAFIRDHAGQDLTLDFEGSDVPSLAFFYESFGATEEYFGWLRINRLPKWISWIKPLY